MAILVIVLRAIHILGGIFWVGSMMMLYGFVVPSAAATRPESGRFVEHLLGKMNLSAWMTVASLATVVAGLVLFAPISGQFDSGWMRSTRGIVLSVGALFGVGAMLEGLFVIGPTGRRIGAMGRELKGPPTPEQSKQFEALQAKLRRAGTRGTWMAGFAAVCMAVARYV